ncbi:MAG: hypothetical protein J6L96_10295 [Clostridia bacterium]|nr:hypothetical protein [Clostridia bacterium]
MKKFIACVLLLTLTLSALVSCGDTSSDAVSSLEQAKDYVYNTYKNAAEVYIADYKVIGQVIVGDETFSVTWTTDAAEENVKIIPGDDNMVTIDINEKNPEEVVYTLTATLTDAEGNTETVKVNRRTPAAIIIDEGMSYAEIVEAAYKLEAGIAMEDAYRLYGEIISIDTAWSDQYKNITVTIKVEGAEDKPIMCYRLKGEGANALAVGDKITVEGILKNYNGTIEFDAGCELLGVGAEVKDQSAILEAAYKLEAGLSMTEPCTLTGVIKNIDTAWSDQYKNITVTIVCDGDEEHPIMCYRLAGEGADTLAVGDTITVTGTIKNYNGTIEFDAGCSLDNLIKSEEPAPVAPSNPADIVDAAYALEEGASLPYTATLEGIIVSIDSEYSEQYGNITVTIQVGDLADKPIQCFRLKGEGAETLEVGDKITVTGMIKNYSGKIEFDAGCTLDKIAAEAPTDPADIVAAAYALEQGATLDYEATLTGTILSIDSAYSEQYGNITVTIQVGDLADKPIQCFRLKGEGAADLAVGDVITVVGTIKNYNGTIEFDAGCKLVSEN